MEYVYSISRPGGALIIVRFYVGQPMEQSLVDLYDKLMSNQDLLPPGAEPFLVKPKDVNDVPIVTLTLSSQRYGNLNCINWPNRCWRRRRKLPARQRFHRRGSGARTARAD